MCKYMLDYFITNGSQNIDILYPPFYQDFWDLSAMKWSILYAIVGSEDRQGNELIFQTFVLKYEKTG